MLLSNNFERYGVSTSTGQENLPPTTMRSPEDPFLIAGGTASYERNLDECLNLLRSQRPDAEILDRRTVHNHQVILVRSEQKLYEFFEGTKTGTALDLAYDWAINAATAYATFFEGTRFEFLEPAKKFIDKFGTLPAVSQMFTTKWINDLNAIHDEWTAKYGRVHQSAGHSNGGAQAGRINNVDNITTFNSQCPLDKPNQRNFFTNGKENIFYWAQALGYGPKGEVVGKGGHGIANFKTEHAVENVAKELFPAVAATPPLKDRDVKPICVEPVATPAVPSTEIRQKTVPATAPQQTTVPVALPTAPEAQKTAGPAPTTPVAPAVVQDAPVNVDKPAAAEEPRAPQEKKGESIELKRTAADNALSATRAAIAVAGNVMNAVANNEAFHKKTEVSIAGSEKAHQQLKDFKKLLVRECYALHFSSLEPHPKNEHDRVGYKKLIASVNINVKKMRSLNHLIDRRVHRLVSHDKVSEEYFAKKAHKIEKKAKKSTWLSSAVSAVGSAVSFIPHPAAQVAGAALSAGGCIAGGISDRHYSKKLGKHERARMEIAGMNQESAQIYAMLSQYHQMGVSQTAEDIIRLRQFHREYGAKMFDPKKHQSKLNHDKKTLQEEGDDLEKRLKKSKAKQKKYNYIEKHLKPPHKGCNKECCSLRQAKIDKVKVRKSQLDLSVQKLQGELKSNKEEIALIDKSLDQSVALQDFRKYTYRFRSKFGIKPSSKETEAERKQREQNEVFFKECHELNEDYNNSIGIHEQTVGKILSEGRFVAYELAMKRLRDNPNSENAFDIVNNMAEISSQVEILFTAAKLGFVILPCALGVPCASVFSMIASGKIANKEVVQSVAILGDGLACLLRIVGIQLSLGRLHAKPDPNTWKKEAVSMGVFTQEIANLKKANRELAQQMTEISKKADANTEKMIIALSQETDILFREIDEFRKSVESKLDRSTLVTHKNLLYSESARYDHMAAQSNQQFLDNLLVFVKKLTDPNLNGYDVSNRVNSNKVIVPRVPPCLLFENPERFTGYLATQLELKEEKLAVSNLELLLLLARVALQEFDNRREKLSEEETAKALIVIQTLKQYIKNTQSFIRRLPQSIEKLIEARAEYAKIRQTSALAQKQHAEFHSKALLEIKFKRYMERVTHQMPVIVGSRKFFLSRELVDSPFLRHLPEINVEALYDARSFIGGYVGDVAVKIGNWAGGMFVAPIFWDSMNLAFSYFGPGMRPTLNEKKRHVRVFNSRYFIDKSDTPLKSLLYPQEGISTFAEARTCIDMQVKLGLDLRTRKITKLSRPEFNAETLLVDVTVDVGETGAHDFVNIVKDQIWGVGSHTGPGYRKPALSTKFDRASILNEGNLKQIPSNEACEFLYNVKVEKMITEYNEYLCHKILQKPIQSNNGFKTIPADSVILPSVGNGIPLAFPKRLVESIKKHIATEQAEFEATNTGSFYLSYDFSFETGELNVFFEFGTGADSKKKYGRINLALIDQATLRSFKDDLTRLEWGQQDSTEFLLQAMYGGAIFAHGLGLPGVGTYTLSNGIVAPKEVFFKGFFLAWEAYPEDAIHYVPQLNDGGENDLERMLVPQRFEPQSDFIEVWHMILGKNKASQEDFKPVEDAFSHFQAMVRLHSNVDPVRLNAMTHCFLGIIPQEEYKDMPHILVDFDKKVQAGDGESFMHQLTQFDVSTHRSEMNRLMCRLKDLEEDLIFGIEAK